MPDRKGDATKGLHGGKQGYIVLGTPQIYY